MFAFTGSNKSVRLRAGCKIPEMGAPLLPVGLFTEVSPSALAAGQGSADGTLAGADGAFAQVLAGLSGDGTGDSGAEAQAATGVSAFVPQGKPAGAQSATTVLSGLPGVTEAGAVAVDQSDLLRSAEKGARTSAGSKAESALPDFEEFALDAEDGKGAVDDAPMAEAAALVQPVPVPFMPAFAAAADDVQDLAGLESGGAALDAATGFQPAEQSSAAAGDQDVASADQQLPGSGLPANSSGKAETSASQATSAVPQVAAIVASPDRMPAGQPRSDAGPEAGVKFAEASGPQAAALPQSAVAQAAKVDPVGAADPKVSTVGVAEQRTPGLKPVSGPVNAVSVGQAADGGANGGPDVRPEMPGAAPVAAGLDPELAVAAGVRDRLTGIAPAAASRRQNAGVSNSTEGAEPAVQTDTIVRAKGPGKRWQSELPEIARASQGAQSQSQTQVEGASLAVSRPQAIAAQVSAGALQATDEAALPQTGDFASGLDVPDPAQKPVFVQRASTLTVADSGVTGAPAPVAQSAGAPQAPEAAQGGAAAGPISLSDAQPAPAGSQNRGTEISLPQETGDAVSQGDAVNPELPDSLAGKSQKSGPEAFVANASTTAGTQKSDAAKSDAAGAVLAAAAGAVVLTDEDGASDSDGLTMDGDFALQARHSSQNMSRMEAVTAQAQSHAQSQAGQAASQIATAMARTLNNGDTKFQMRLDPPELGRVEVHMKVAKDGSVQAHMIVDSPETLDMFMRDQRGLERALTNAGLNTDSSSLQFSLRDGGGQGFAFSQDNGSSGGRSEHSSSPQEPDEAISEPAAGIYAARNQSGLDIRI